LKTQLFIILQKITPQLTLSALAGRVADSRISWLKNRVIRWFQKKYQVNLDEAEISDIDQHPSFNHFFTRSLKSDARPICPGESTLCSPADGSISQIGDISDGKIVQAKGSSFTISDLLCCSDEEANQFQSGKFVLRTENSSQLSIFLATYFQSTKRHPKTLTNCTLAMNA